MKIDAKSFSQTLEQMHEQILNQMSQMHEQALSQMSQMHEQMLVYFVILMVLQVLTIVVLVYLLKKESRENKKIYKIILKQNMNLGEEIQKNRDIEQNIDRKLNHLLNNMKNDTNQIANHHPKILTSQSINVHNSHDSFSENLPISDDPKFKELIKAYNQGQGSDVFISLKVVIDNLIKNGSVKSEEEATRMINKLTRIYPSAIMVENVRGQEFPQIAIIN